jgi:hypothetical protein
MVLSARNTGGSIRPMFGSIFAAPQYGRTPETLEVEEEVVSRGRPESVVTPHPDTPRVFENPKPEPRPPASGNPPFQTHTLVAGSGPQKEDFNPISQEKASFKPLVAKAPQEEIEKPAVRSASTVEPAETLARGETREHPKPLLKRTEQKVVSKVLFRPIAVENLRRPDLKTLRDTWHPITYGEGKKEARNLPGRSGMTARAPDEIQIHIGRIEVTAAPPAPVRPAPKPAHKSLDLGAYLKRRGVGPNE